MCVCEFGWSVWVLYGCSRGVCVCVCVGVSVCVCIGKAAGWWLMDVSPGQMGPAGTFYTNYPN